jgi:probable phosphoglycerate mutase
MLFPETSMNVIGLLRHGPTAWNRDKLIQGQRDIPLDHSTFDPKPWRELLAVHGPWDRIIASPLSRAHATARALFPDRSIELDDDLREQDWGHWTGLTIRGLRQAVPGAVEEQENRAWDFTPPAGESRRRVLARALNALHDATRERDHQRILMVTHFGVIMAVLNHLLGCPFLPDNSAPIAKRALHLVGQDQSGLHVIGINLSIP